MASKFMTLQVSSYSSDSLPQWSKGVDSSSTSVNCVGSNPTAVILSLAFCDVLHVYAFTFLILRAMPTDRWTHCFIALRASNPASRLPRGLEACLEACFAACFEASTPASRLASRPASRPASRLASRGFFRPASRLRGLPQGLPRGLLAGLLQACLEVISAQMRLKILSNLFNFINFFSLLRVRLGTPRIVLSVPPP